MKNYRVNLAGVAFILIGLLLSLALWTPIPIYCFLGVSLLATIVVEARKHWDEWWL